MKIQPMGNAFKVTAFVYPVGPSPQELGSEMARTASRLRRSLGADPDPEETSRRALVWQSVERTPAAEPQGKREASGRDGRRCFTPWQKQQLFLKSGGCCSLCGAELRADWEADHIAPHSSGGLTELANGQALCGACNQRKRDERD